ncbi:LamG domain-containing protein [Verrucomicrobiaceae bacterium 5K15]|uniref:LamG domain-containing protein n=1 Tax=Oceaniferula flava TaxID=2800421 RepID=A0AAE2VE04_9BACT|nr:LamG domain-containing protein [Oceaniferula flavus]MBK1855224.1 LamG domain-containing protein [Oceaniferula flavus]MBM1136530.1 LamG domain-containing protein [Oceaniferula flavus]
MTLPSIYKTLFATLMITSMSAHAGLVGHWTFDETSGTTAADSSGGGYHGKVVNPSWTRGLIGGALKFDGSCQVVDFGTVLSNTANELSIAVWCYGAPSKPDGNLFFAHVNGEPKLNAHFPHKNGRIYFDTFTSAKRDRLEKAYARDEESLLWGNWNHWVFTKNASEGSMKIYVNSQLWHEVNGTNTPVDPSADFIIGSGHNDQFYHGALDDFRVYDHALSASEVTTLYKASAPPHSLVLKAPNGHRIPKIMGATADTAMLTGFDYLNWWGITEHRSWFKPSFSQLADNSSITSAAAFAKASEDIRKNPMRQASASNYYIDWKHLHTELERHGVPEHMQYLANHDIMAMLVSSRDISKTPITGDWETIFRYWKYWYAIVYHYASTYDVTMYQYRNEPHHWISYDVWESHWLVHADATRKAIADVNAAFGKSLKPNLCGPVCAGSYWDNSLTEPYVKGKEGSSPHNWGNISWKKVKYDIFGKYRKNNPLNYHSYDYHRYGDALGAEKIMLRTRNDVATADNDPMPDLPLVISEYNTNTGGTFTKKKLDTEDLHFGVTMAQILQVSGEHGPNGLGEDGGIFIFKLGASQKPELLEGVGNKLSYVSRQEPKNYGGITRGGACFQMYAKHFCGGKPLVPVEVVSGAHYQRRTLAAIDEAKQMYYIYGSNTSGVGVPVSIDLSALKVEAGAVVSLQRVDEYNTGQVTELLALDHAKKLSFDAPNYTAYLIKVPMAGAVSARMQVIPSEDTTQQVAATESLGAAATIKVSNHHSDPSQRNVGLLRFRLGSPAEMQQVLLKISGRNSGSDQSEREILHVYAVTDTHWSEGSAMQWADAPGLGKYHITQTTMGSTDGTGDMIDIEDNHAGYSSGVGKGLGLYGEFLGAVSFHASDYRHNYLDVTDYLQSVAGDKPTMDVTFVIARTVRYNVNEYSNSYYHRGDYHYDGRVVEIASKEHAHQALRPVVIFSKGKAQASGQ